jgi:alpha-glucosidase
MQLGAFTPFFRGHTIINTRDQEPWAFGDEVEGWVKEVVDLRYELLPFFYNEFYNATQTGIPIVHSMFLNYQNDGKLRRVSLSKSVNYLILDNKIY